MSNAVAAKVTELSARRDELKSNHKPNKELRAQIVDLKMQLKGLPEGEYPERTKLAGELAMLEQKRLRSPELAAVMVELGKARRAAVDAELDAFIDSVKDKSDAELEALHLDYSAQRAALKPKVTALARLRSARAKVAVNKALLKDLTPEEILAALTPEQRKALVEKK